jgi:hypothetical protein
MDSVDRAYANTPAETSLEMSFQDGWLGGRGTMQEPYRARRELTKTKGRPFGIPNQPAYI